MKKILILLILILSSFTIAEDNRFFQTCEYGKDDLLVGACYLKEILLSLENDSNSGEKVYDHASLKNNDWDYPETSVVYPYHICCEGDELKATKFNNDDVWGNAPILKLSGNTNAHAATIYSEPYWVNASFQAPGGIYCMWEEEQPVVSGTNQYLALLSLSIGESNNHIGNKDAYPLKLWCRGGIPMRSTPGIKLPIGEDIIILDDGEPGLVINESAASEEEEFYAKKECENVNECVALVNGEPACFQIGSEYDVDNFTESGMVEICSENNYWCPKWFDNSNTEKCVFEMDQCYDQTATDTDLCWTQEINETNPEYQNALWIADLDKCSYKSFEGVIRSCCAVTVIHNEPYQSWRDVCILIAGQDNSHCSIVFN